MQSIEDSLDVTSMTASTAKLFGMLSKDNRIMKIGGDFDRSKFSQEKWKFMLLAPFDISSECCRVMKKKPVHDYEKQTGRKGFTGQMADESRLRLQKWLQNGCNSFEGNKAKSNPMSFWTENDVLAYIKQNNLKIASVYGEIVEVNEGEEEGQLSMDFVPKTYKTTGCKRTGCMFCGYGCHLEKGTGRFERMKETHPTIYKYIMKPKEEGGLGYKEVIDWLNENGDLHIKY